MKTSEHASGNLEYGIWVCGGFNCLRDASVSTAETRVQGTGCANVEFAISKVKGAERQRVARLLFPDFLETWNAVTVAGSRVRGIPW